MSVKVYIDGQEGTTGLKILERFKDRNDIEIMKIDEDKRKDNDERKKFICSSDFTFLCLPDAAAREAVELAKGSNVRIIDASTAHRTNPDWAYGFPELSKQHREKIAASSRVAVPGCYASGFISLVYPLVKAGIMPSDYPVVAHAVSGYSGAGKKAIAVYESDEKPEEFYSPRQYALPQEHKHLPFSGMVVTVPVLTRLLPKKYTLADIHKAFTEHYADANLVKVMPVMGEGVLENGFLAANTLSGKNNMEIFVCGNDDRIVLCSRLDNLGKGASGAAVQCLNIMMGIDETTGLV